jgi:lipopolysaccharide/colanic/teichoic acid biosynthesis glycosyltransferase
MRRTVDVLVSLVALIVFAPLLAAIAIVVRVCLGPGVLFRQVRPGLHGEPFTIWKFRTMRDERAADGSQLPDSMRMTRVGQFLRSSSLDELPELVNVLRGDMSLIGPRPLMMAYLPLYTPEQARRHEVRPGITGLAQVSGRNAISWEEKFALDVHYVDHQSLALDLQILWRTLVKVVSRDGISAEGFSTAPAFTGTPRDGAGIRV